MMDAHWIAGIMYALCLAALGLWGIHRFVLLQWLRRTDTYSYRPHAATPTFLVQLPVYNEPTVVSRIIDAVARLDWPAIEIQLLDDSTDETTAIATNRIAHWAEQGVMISHIRRHERLGYKAGALAHGLELSPAKYIDISGRVKTFDSVLVRGASLTKPYDRVP